MQQIKLKSKHFITWIKAVSFCMIKPLPSQIPVLTWWSHDQLTSGPFSLILEYRICPLSLAMWYMDPLQVAMPKTKARYPHAVLEETRSTCAMTSRNAESPHTQVMQVAIPQFISSIGN